jgi:predicted GNAT family N-acyltransferase
MINYVHNILVEDYNFLRKSVGWNEIDKIQAQIGINNSAYLVVAMHDDKTVGLARLVSDGGYIAFIVDVIVLPGYQGNGIGKCLIQKVIANIISNLKEGQSVSVNLMSAKGKESFYNQFGFINRPNDDVGCGMTQWISKSISK